MKQIRLFTAVVIATLLASCATTRHNSTYSNVDPTEVRLNIDMHDMECLGEVEISITEEIYLGFIKSTRYVNGQKYQGWNKTTTSLAGTTWDKSAKGMEKATYKVLEKFPKADFYKVVRQSVKTQRMFGMKEVSRTATIKAYRVKAGNHGITTCGGNCHK